MSALRAPTVLAAILLGGCIPEGVEADPTPAPAASAAATPTSTPATEASVAPTGRPALPPPLLRRDFEIEGEIEQGGWLRGLAPSQAVSVTLGSQQVVLGKDGAFFAAFDRDAGPSLRLTATMDDGSLITRELDIRPRAWQIERVNVARRPSGSSEAFLARRRPELAAIGSARARETGAQGWRQDFIWPVEGRISGRFGSQRIYAGEPGSYHTGIDIAPGAGTPFVAPADGVVVLAADDFSLEGKLLIIDHGGGLNSAFLHSSKLAVKEGDTVGQGQYIGNVGASGRASGPHLHWGLKWRDTRLDPLLFAGPMR